MNSDIPRLPGRPVIVRAFQPGDIVFIELEHPVTRDHFDKVRELIREQAPQITCVILPAGAKVSAREEIPVTDTEA